MLVVLCGARCHANVLLNSMQNKVIKQQKLPLVVFIGMNAKKFLPEVFNCYWTLSADIARKSLSIQ